MQAIAGAGSYYMFADNGPHKVHANERALKKIRGSAVNRCVTANSKQQICAPGTRPVVVDVSHTITVKVTV